MSSGDFPAVLYDVVRKRTSVIEGSLSIDDLNEILDELSKNMGKGLDCPSSRTYFC
jgi:DNA ligase 4